MYGAVFMCKVTVGYRKRREQAPALPVRRDFVCNFMGRCGNRPLRILRSFCGRFVNRPNKIRNNFHCSLNRLPFFINDDGDGDDAAVQFLRYGNGYHCTSPREIPIPA